MTVIKLISFTLIVVATLASCTGNKEKHQEVSADQIDMHQAENSLDVWGEYTGLYPYADSPGIDVSLKLEQDMSYTLKWVYPDRETDLVVSGNYTIDKNLLTTHALTGEITYYKIGENSLICLDQEGKLVADATAPLYKLSNVE